MNPATVNWVLAANPAVTGFDAIVSTARLAETEAAVVARVVQTATLAPPMPMPERKTTLS